MNRDSRKFVSLETFKLLMELSGRINSKLDLDTILLEIIKAAKQIGNGEASTLMMYDEESDELILSIPTGPADVEVSGERFPVDQGIAGWVVKNEKPQVVNDPEGDERFRGDFDPELFKTRNLVCVPMVNIDGEVIGCLQTLNKKGGEDFDEDDQFILMMLANQAAVAIETAKLHEKRVENELMKKSLSMAGDIQKRFSPSSSPSIPGYDIAGTTHPATEVGGDYFDFIPLGDSNQWGFVVADVAGKGMPASLLMATVRTSLRTQLVNDHPIRETVQLVNKTICEDSPMDKFITLFYGELDPSNHSFTYINAGHNYPFLVDFNKGELSRLSEGGMMLGIDPNVEFTSNSVSLDPGQMILIFTDGISEAENEKEEMFGEEALGEWLLDRPNESAVELQSQLLEEIEAFQGTTDQSDDITVEVIKRRE